MKKSIFAIIALASAFCSCEKEEIETPKESSKMTITAILGDDEDTRTIMDGDDLTGYKTLWSEGDQIKIYNPKDSQTYTYTLTAGEGTVAGTFTGDALPYGEYIATYGTGFSYGASSGFLASEQQFICDNDASYIHMTAKVHVYTDEEETVARITNFKNATGLLRLNLNGTGTVSKIKVTTDKNISGIFTLDNTDGSVKITQNIIGVYKYITFNCGETGIDLSRQEKTFYISIPKGEYNAVKIEITDIYNCVITKSLKADKELNIERSRISPVHLTAKFPRGKTINSLGDTVNWCRLWDGSPAWAEYNVGAQKATDFGNYYRGVMSIFNYEWGNNWHAPSLDDLWALADKCTTEWTTIDGINGRLYTGKGSYSKYSIFLPAAGYYEHPYLINREGFYWSSTEDNPNLTGTYKYLRFYNSGQTWGVDKSQSYSIRMVLVD